MMDDMILLFKKSSYFSSKVVHQRFDVSKIRGITKNVSENSSQFCIHLMKQNDEVMESPDRFNVIEAIKFLYFVVEKKNLKVYKAHSIPTGDKVDFDMKLDEDNLIPSENLFNERTEDPASPQPPKVDIKVVTTEEVDISQLEFVKNKPVETL